MYYSAEWSSWLLLSFLSLSLSLSMLSLLLFLSLLLLSLMLESVSKLSEWLVIASAAAVAVANLEGNLEIFVEPGA